MEKSIKRFKELLADENPPHQITDDGRRLVETKINATRWWLSQVRKLEERGQP
jgi:hypothetical protein